jgi:hypothetical protein
VAEGSRTKDRIQGLTMGAMLALLTYFGIIKPDQYMLTSFLGVAAIIEVLIQFNVIRIRSKWMHVVSGFLSIYGILGFLFHA